MNVGVCRDSLCLSFQPSSFTKFFLKYLSVCIRLKLYPLSMRWLEHIS